MTRPDDDPRPAVAVVAVHGVADQAPHTSARAVADLLARLGGERYASFVESHRALPTEPSPLEPSPGEVEAAEGGFLRRLAARFEERSALLRRRARVAARRPEVRPVEEPDLLFMRDQLAGYRSDGEPYRTVRLEGDRVEEGEVTSRVHVYEMHWADLSRASTRALRLLGELYQLILHLPNLGRQSLDMAELAHPGEGSWRWYGRLHRWAVRLFTVLLPVLVVLSVAVLLVPLPVGVLAADGPWGTGGWRNVLVGGLGIGLLALLAAVGTGYVTRRLAARRSTVLLFLLAPYAVATVVVVLALPLVFRPPPVRSLLSGEQLLVAVGCLLALIGVVGLFAAYERLRPGALWAAVALAVPTFAVFLVLCLAPPFRGGDALVDISLWLFEVLLLATLLSSLVVYLLAFAAAVIGSWLSWRAQGSDERGRVRRLNWTVRGTLALSVSLFLVVNLTFGSILHGTAGRFLPGAEENPFAMGVLPSGSPAAASTGIELQGLVVAEIQSGTDLHCPVPFLPVHLAEKAPPADFLGELLTRAATGGFLFILGLLTLLAFTLLGGLLPVAWAELRPPRVDWARGLRGVAWRRARQRRDDWAEEMGRSLSTVFPWVGRLVMVLFLCVVVVMPVISVVELVQGERDAATQGEADAGMAERSSQSEESWLIRATRTLLITTGSLVGAVVVALVLGGRLNALALGFRPFLEVALDVDNYLRQVPRRRTPRARMVERYTSLLHYLHRWRDPAGRAYAAVLLVAHSQGTVLTTDVLRYLARERSPALGFGGGATGRRDDSPELYLFTMGSPLRQLYLQCFPYLYGWVERAGIAPDPEPWDGDPAGTADGDRQVVPTLPGTAPPDPAALALRRWVNAYRSGDYVGRALWRTADTWPHLYRACAPEADAGVLYTVSEDPGGRRRELCIGPGAHTHYWNATAPAIARELDLLIGEAVDRR